MHHLVILSAFIQKKYLLDFCFSGHGHIGFLFTSWEQKTEKYWLMDWWNDIFGTFAMHATLPASLTLVFYITDGVATAGHKMAALMVVFVTFKYQFLTKQDLQFSEELKCVYWTYFLLHSCW